MKYKNKHKKVSRKPKFKIGEYIIVIRRGRAYSSYKEMATLLGASQKWSCWCMCINEGNVGRVINRALHKDRPETQGYVYLVDLGAHEVLIGEEDIKKTNTLYYTLHYPNEVKN